MTSCANAILAGALDVSGDLSGRAAKLSLRHFTLPLHNPSFVAAQEILFSTSRVVEDGCG